MGRGCRRRPRRDMPLNCNPLLLGFLPFLLWYSAALKRSTSLHQPTKKVRRRNNAMGLAFCMRFNAPSRVIALSYSCRLREGGRISRPLSLFTNQLNAAHSKRLPVGDHSSSVRVTCQQRCRQVFHRHTTANRLWSRTWATLIMHRRIYLHL